MTTYAEGKQLRKRREADLRLRNNRLGMNIFQLSWIMAFVAMALVNWQLRFSYAQWPPAGVAAFDLLLPSLATVALLLSSLFMRQALHRLHGGVHVSFLRALQIAIGLGGFFVLVIVYEFLAVSEAALATQYGITFRLMTGFHFVHALAILAILIRVYRQASRGAYSGDPRDSWPVEGAAKLWYFVTVAWLLFYVVLYWIK